MQDRLITSRELVLNTLDYRPAYRPPCDLMENKFPDSLLRHFHNDGIFEQEEMLEKLGADCRWINIGKFPFFTDIVHNQINKANVADECESNTDLTLSDATLIRPMADASLSDIQAIEMPLFDESVLPDFAQLRAQWRDKAIILSSSAPPLFMSACEVFGLEEALCKMAAEPEIFNAFIVKLHQYNMDALEHELKHAKGSVDILRLWDDVASQDNLLFSPKLWREHIKPCLAEEIALIKSYGIRAMYHECGNIRPLIPDFIEIGINCLEVFQTSAKNMDPQSIAAEFGGKIAFYGGVDVQNLLTYGTPEDVRREVTKNILAFETAGGYIVANSHNGTEDIKADTLLEMFRTAVNWA